MASQNFEMIFMDPIAPEKGGYPGLNPRTERAEGMLIEYDVAVPMRDGIKIYIDVYRPEEEAKHPVILCWGPYGKFGRVK
jgi:uncharacterized protein